MHRRNSTNPRRLDRRKSATSVKSVYLEYIAPETAERDAQLAATKAFARARAQSTADSASCLWPPSRSTAGPSSYTTSGSPRANTRSDETAVRRQQSVRFIQPRPPQLIPNSEMTQETSSGLHGPGDHVANHEANPHPPSGASAFGMASAIKGTAGDHIDTLLTSEEYYTPEDDIASMPSSYRKLRKSRSMFTECRPMTAPSHPTMSKPSITTNQLPQPTITYSRAPQKAENIPPRRLKTPKSMSFLRDLRGSLVSSSKSEVEDAPFTSTSQNVGNSENPHGYLRPKSSRYFLAGASSQERVFKKSMRDTSDSGISIPNIKPVKDGSLRLRARKVSQGLKHKLKNLFGSTKGDSEDIAHPLQNSTAQRSHIFASVDSQQDMDYEVPSPSPADRTALYQVHSGTPSLHAVPSYQQVRSRKGSIESLRSEQKTPDERSRVTSWSNSETNTVMTYNSFEEREKKRLSVINEHGTHVCSSSAAQFLTISEQSNASSTSLNRLVLPALPALPIQQAQTASTPVDGQRVYSALMKRMEQSQQEKMSDGREQSNIEDAAQSSTKSQRRNSIRPSPFGRTRPPTIRYVLPDSESDSEPVQEVNRFDRKGKQKSNVATGPGEQGRLGSEHLGRIADEGSSKASDNEALAIPNTEEEYPPLQTLSSRSSAFFGSPTCHQFRAQSPYRRAIQDRMSAAPDEEQMRSTGLNPYDPSMASLSNLPNLALPRSGSYGSDADAKLNYTESVYSTNTDEGQSKGQGLLSVKEDLPRPRSTHGDATIFLNPPELKKRSTSLPPKPRVSSSSASSVEWKMWLSSNVSKLEDTTSHVDYSTVGQGLTSSQSSGHVREHAQIMSDEDEYKEDKAPDPPSPRSKSQRNTRYSTLDTDSDVDDSDQPTPFDAGDVRPEILPFQQRSPAIAMPSNASTSSMPSPIYYPNRNTTGTGTATTTTSATPTPTRNTSSGLYDKLLPKIPTLRLKGNNNNNSNNRPIGQVPLSLSSNRATSGTTAVAAEDDGEKEREKKKKYRLNSFTGSRRGRADSLASATKPENVSPATTSTATAARHSGREVEEEDDYDDDPYDMAGAGILGPDHPQEQRSGVGGKRMVDIFLSSRRRRMTSDGEGSVFL